MLCFTVIDSTVQRSVTDPCNPASTYFSPDLQGLEYHIKKKEKQTPTSQPQKNTSPIQKSRAVKAEVPIMPVNNLQKFLLQDLECDSKILQHAEVWEE